MLKIQRVPYEIQPELFPIEYSGKFKSTGEARSRMGARVEKLVCEALNLRELKTNGNYDVCFDAAGENSKGIFYFEIKSVRRGSKSPIYDFRLRKELLAQAQIERPLLYAFFTHDLKNLASQEDITQKLLKSKKLSIYVLTLNELFDIAIEQPLKKIKAGKGGYNRKGYAEGYRNVPECLIREKGVFNYGKYADVSGNNLRIEVNFSDQAHRLYNRVLQ